MSSSQLPGTAIPKPLPDDDDDVSWALQTAAVQWGRGAYQDAIVWLRRAAESAIDLSAWSRAADLNATASRLEKQIGKLPPQPAAPLPSHSAPNKAPLPSAPPRNAILPSFPVPTTSVPPAGSLGRRQTTGYSSLPPLPVRSPSSQPAPGRSSVVIDVEEEELELSEDEIRQLESESQQGADIPNGARPSWMSSQRPAPMEASSESLPAFSLESSRPSDPGPSRRSSAHGGGLNSSHPPGALPSFPLERSARMPPTSAVPSRGASRSTAPPAAGNSSLPAFPLENTGSSLPPVSKWPRMGSPGTSHLPPTPGLPDFDTAPPSRPFVDDGDDGAPGIDEQGLEIQPLEEPMLEPLEPIEEDGGSMPPMGPAAIDTRPPPGPPIEDLELLDLDSPRSARPLGNLPLRSGRASSRPRVAVAPLPPAIPDGRTGGVRARTMPTERRSASRAPSISALSRPPAPPLSDAPVAAAPTSSAVPRRSDPSRGVPAAPPARTTDQPRHAASAFPEPRMPKRALSYASPLDFRSKAQPSEPAARRTSVEPEASESLGAHSDRVPSNAPTIRRMEAAEPASIPPPGSMRSIEPEDLPTVTSPSLSRPPLEVSSRGTVESSNEQLREPPRQPPSFAPSESLIEGREPKRQAEVGETPILPSRPSPPEERRRISFKFDERRTSERSTQESTQAASSWRPREQLSADRQPEAQPAVHPIVDEDYQEEPLAVLPPVSTRVSGDSKAPASQDVVLSGVRLAEVRGFSDLPASAHRMLARTARIESLATGEEASFFSVALVLDGWVGLMPAIADTACATAVVGEVVFTEGSLSEGVMLRVVAGQDDVVVATWDSAAIAEATKDCPWVADDLKLLADGFQALAGACLGPLGDRLDDSLRSIVTSRCEIRTLLPGEQLCAAGKPVPGMHIIGGGEIELFDDNGRVAKTYGSGEFLYAPQVLAGGVAPFAARAGSKGALVLFAPRMSAHELLVSVPPLLEILAE